MPTVFVTICTIRQLPQAFALGDSLSPNAPDSSGQPEPFLIGLADDPAHLPAHFASPYPLLPIDAVLPPATRTALSATYTPTEFAAACKPRFLAEVFRRYPDAQRLVYADPNVLFLRPLDAVWDQLREATALLTPHITQHPSRSECRITPGAVDSPGDTARPDQAWPGQAWPDEKFFQNVGLYSADFLAFRRSAETDRLLAWWQDRVQERAYVDFCAGLCTDQLWLMHVPVFFEGVRLVKNPGWHVALWNLPERTLEPDGAGWRVSGPTNPNQPVIFFNAKGLFNADEGFFPHQNRLRLADRPDVRALLATYRQAVAVRADPVLTATGPAYGQQPEPVVLRGWRRATVRSMRAITRFLDRVPLPAVR